MTCACCDCECGSASANPGSSLAYVNEVDIALQAGYTDNQTVGNGQIDLGGNYTLATYAGASPNEFSWEGQAHPHWFEWEHTYAITGYNHSTNSLCPASHICVDTPAGISWLQDTANCDDFYIRREDYEWQNSEYASPGSFTPPFTMVRSFSRKYKLMCCKNGVVTDVSGDGHVTWPNNTANGYYRSGNSSCGTQTTTANTWTFDYNTGYKFTQEEYVPASGCHPCPGTPHPCDNATENMTEGEIATTSGPGGPYVTAHEIRDCIP